MKRCSGIRYCSMQPVALSLEDSIKVLNVTDDGDIILQVNSRTITLVEYEKQLNINI